MASLAAFVPTPASRQVLPTTLGNATCWTCRRRRAIAPSVANRPVARTTPRQLLPHLHSLPELMNQLIMSCGVGLAGIVGSKATSQVRALTEGDRRADAMEALASDIDSLRRRKELKEGRGVRDWSDVCVDKLSNVVVVPQTVPLLEAKDELDAFDSLLGDVKAISAPDPSPSTESEMSSSGDAQEHREHTLKSDTPLPLASEFVLDDDSEVDPRLPT